MDATKVLEVIDLYRKKFEGSGIDKENYDHQKILLTKDYHVNARKHCHSMLDQIEEFVKEGRMEKAFRWLGFIQGVLWVLQVYRLEDLKNHNRPTE